MTNPVFRMNFTYGPLQNISYGYLWWFEEAAPHSAWFALGHGGQFIYVVPSLELVVVTTTYWKDLSSEGGPQPLTESVLEIIINKILPAVIKR